MRGENDKTPEISALEAALSALTPAPSRIDRDELMFRAGAATADASRTPVRGASSHRAAWLWPLTTAASTLLAATLGVLYGGRGTPSVIERIVERPVDRIVEVPVYLTVSSDRTPQAIASASPDALPTWITPGGPTSGSYLRLRDTALARGVDSLSYLQGSHSPDTAQPSSYSDLRRDLLPGPTTRAAEPDRFNSTPQRAQETRT